MTAVAQPAASRRTVGVLRGALWRHPELPWAIAVVSSWVALGAWHWADHDSAAPLSWRFDAGSWTLMVVAMMVAGTLPMVRRLAFGSLWRRRHRNTALFTAAYVGVWVALGVGAALAVAGIEAVGGLTFNPGRGSVAVTVLMAAAWQFTATKRRALRRCHLARPVAARGRAADRSVIAFGLYHARACAWSCGPMMLAMFVAAHDFHLMAPLAAVSLVERYQTRPTERLGGVALVVVAALTAFTVGV